MPTSPALRLRAWRAWFIVAHMVRAVRYGEVQYFEIGRSFAGLCLRTSGVYFVDGLLIDTGPPNVRREFEGLLRQLPVEQVINTHHHEDHVGNNVVLERRGLVPYASEQALGRLQNPARLEFYRRLVWGTPRSAVGRPVPPVVETPRCRFRVIETPGHAEDHICLYEESRGWLFSGDLYLSSRLKYLRADEDVHALLRSLERVAALEPERLYCAHRGEVPEPREALRRKIENLNEMGNRIQELHRSGLAAEEIIRRLFPAPHWIEILSRGHFSRANFVRAFLQGASRPSAT